MNLVENGMVVGAQAEYERREREDYTDVAIRDLKKDPEKFVCDHVADPYDIAARVFRICAENRGDHAMIGRLISNTVFEMELKRAAVALEDAA